MFRVLFLPAKNSTSPARHWAAYGGMDMHRLFPVCVIATGIDVSTPPALYRRIEAVIVLADVPRLSSRRRAEIEYIPSSGIVIPPLLDA